jgi:hypothetical protein
MKKALFIGLAVMLLAVGCAVEEITPTPTLTLTPTPISTPTPTPTPTPTALFLEIVEPANESIVGTASIILSGTTIPGAVVSISVDDEIEIADVDEQGNFSATVTLAEGPNYIEVLASDQEGNEEYSTLVVIYSP